MLLFVELIRLVWHNMELLVAEWTDRDAWQSLEVLELANLQLQGTLPVLGQSGGLPNLLILDLNRAGFNDTLPPALLSGLPSLRSLKLSGNNFTGMHLLF